MRVRYSVVLFLSIVAAAQAQNTNSALQVRIAETERQRIANQRLMWDAALDAAEAFSGIAASQGDASSGENLRRLAELTGEIKAAARGNDAISAAKLIAEAGRLIGLEGLTRTSEAAEAVAGAVGTALTIPLNILPAAQAYSRFLQRSADDARLLQRKADLQHQLEALPAVSPPVKRPLPPKTVATEKDFSELDKAIVQMDQTDKRHQDEFAGIKQNDPEAYHKAMDQCRRVYSPESSRCMAIAGGPGSYFETMKAGRACLDTANAALKTCSDAASAKYELEKKQK